MDYVDDTSRPRFQFQSRPSDLSSAAAAAAAPPQSLLKIAALPAAACFASAVLLLLPAFYLSDNQPLSLLFLWFSLSLLAGPFAPPSLTGGDPVVGRGDPLPPPPSPPTFDSEDTIRKPHRRHRSHPVDPDPQTRIGSIPKAPIQISDRPSQDADADLEEEEEKEWDDADFELLKKQLVKHPVGAPRRWEKITEAFRGRHGQDSVIRTAKSLSEKRPGTGDSFAQFLKQRKPIDKRAEASIGDSAGDTGGWSAGEDIALLNALKAFPKEAALRWEKIAAAVPGKTKACCVKRVAELKRDFRSSKAS